MKLISCCALIGLSAFLNFSASGQVDYTFTGNKDGTNWFDPGNWSVGGLPATQIPGPNDNVTIGPNQLTAVISSSVVVNALTILNRGALDGPGNIRVKGTFDLNSTVALQNPKIGGAGTLFLDLGTMNVRGTVSLARSVTNNGTIALLQSGGIGPALLGCASNISIWNYGTITLEDGTELLGGANLEVLGGGSIQKPTGISYAYLGESSSLPGPNISVDAGGLISVRSGELWCYPTLVSGSEGELHAESNATIYLFGVQDLHGQITGAGHCILDGYGEVDPLLGNLQVTGNLILENAHLVSGLFFPAPPGQVSIMPGGTLYFTSGFGGTTVSNMVINSAGTIIIESGSTTLTRSFITNSGMALWQGSDTVLEGATNSSIFVNNGQFTDTGDHEFDVQFFNTGIFTKILADTNNPTGTGSGKTTFLRFEDQNGGIGVMSGTVSLQSGTISNTTIGVTGDRSVLQFASRQVTTRGYTAALTTGKAELRVTLLGELTLSSNATLDVTGNLRLIGDRIDGPGTLLLSSGTFWFDGGTLAVSNVVAKGGVIITNAVLGAGQGFSGVNMTNAGMFIMGGPVDMTGTTFNNTQGGVVRAGQYVNLTGTGSTIRNSGLIEVSPGVTVQVSVTIDNSGGQMNVNGSVYAYIVLNGATITVNGLLQPGNGLIQRSGNCNIGPTGKVMGGTITLNGGKINGSGVIVGTLTNNSPSGVDPPQVNGDYTSTSNGTVTIHIGGLAPVTQYDQFNVTGNATLDGTLNINLTNGFLPTLGNQFRVMTFGSHSGAFAVKNGLKLPNGLYLMPIYSSTNLTLITTNVVFIQPAIQVSQGPAPGNIRLSWPGISGQAYQVQFSPDLIQWFVLTNLTATGSALSFSDPAVLPAPAARFYRLR